MFTFYLGKVRSLDRLGMFIAPISKQVFYNRYKREKECFTRSVSHEKTR